MKTLVVDGTQWSYIRLGGGSRNILFLHGLGGAYDIWWQQIEALKDRLGIVSVTYPPLSSLSALGRGLLGILDREQISRVHLVGSSLGGYLAQYLVAEAPQRIEKVILGNTFPPNDLIVNKTRVQGVLLPFMPRAMIMARFRGTVLTEIFPTSNFSQLVKAYLLEQSYGLMSKAQFIARYRCVIDRFTPPKLEDVGIDALIIESANDPLVVEELREKLKATYPTAAVHTFPDGGHFPYLSRPDEYTALIEAFLIG
ncbi:MAG: alpha/beta hydrolase [Acidobacteria bacterium]|nr:MAG: alpha/beta hydrolase [Acidobacteriota bacterium]